MRARVFAPAAISTFYAPKTCNDDLSYLRIGAWGGGFKLSGGVETVVELVGEGADVQIVGLETLPVTSLTAARIARRRLDLRHNIRVTHRVEVPVGSGFGTSAAGALGVGIGLALLSGRDELRGAEIAHEADIAAGTGLQTAAAIYRIEGAAGLIVEPGFPGRYMEIPVPDSLKIITVTLGPIDKKKALSDKERNEKIKSLGLEVLDRIVSERTLGSLLEWSRFFAFKAGFLDSELESLIRVLDRAPGVLGASQNMIGRSAYAVVKSERAGEIADRLKAAYREAIVMVHELYRGKPKGLVET